MHKQDKGLLVMEEVGTSLMRYSFDEEKDEVTVTWPGCGGSFVASAEPGASEWTLEHEHDCHLLTFIESVANQGVLNGN